MYENNNDMINKNIKYKYELKSIDYMKANEEYVRSQVYSVLNEVLTLKQNGKKIQAKQKLNEIKIWLEKNYKGDNKDYLKDVNKSYELFKNDDSIVLRSVKHINSQIMQSQSKKQGSNMKFCNSIQINLMKSISDPFKLRFSGEIANNNFDLRKSVKLDFNFKKLYNE